MNPVSPIPVIVIFILAITTTNILAKCYPLTLPLGRISTIDGLRGYLAFSVFLHHAAIWFFFLRSGRWVVPPSHLYTHLGQSGIVLFFMITGFLFFSKLINSKNKIFDWRGLYISRLFRLVPLYLFVMIIMFSIVAILSNWQLREPIGHLASGVSNWLMFTMRGAPDLNGVNATSIILAGVTWTLPYEWIFYLILPLLAILAGFLSPVGYAIMAILAIIGFIFLNLDLSLTKGFLGGITAAILVRNEKLCVIASKNASAFVILGCLSVVVTIFSTAHSSISVLILTIAFTLIAGGNTLFGLLTNHTSRVLGEITYSIYLLHGILLFMTFRFLIGFPAASKLSPIEHWLIIAMCTPVLISISFITYRKIEAPAMRIAPQFANWIKIRGV